MELDYIDIGKRIKAKRLRRGWGQDRLADFAELSYTHMSHVETGKTKVSLPSLVKIANALGATLDELVCDSLSGADKTFEHELSEEIKDCSEEEIRVIVDTVKALKVSLRKRINRFDR